MIKIDGIEYRNLQEQVLKNKQDIARHYEIDRELANLGIKIVGQITNVNELPDPSTYTGAYGDAYAVGTPGYYDYYVFTRPNINAGDTENHWLNVGSISIQGPKGDQGNPGPAGPQGERGTTWTAYRLTTTALPIVERIEGDMNVNPATGDVARLVNGIWTAVGNIRGPQGMTGVQGIRGPEGPQGPAGPQGPEGPSGQSFYVIGTLASTEELPDPSSVERSGAYLVGNNDDGYDIYIIMGEADVTWFNAGSFTGQEGPQGPAGPQGSQGPQGPAGLQGAVGLTWRGEWNSASTYVERDLVTYMNSVYYAVSTNSGSEPDTSSSWTLLIQAPAQPKQRLASYQVPTPTAGYFRQTSTASTAYLWKTAIGNLPDELYDNLHAIYVEGCLGQPNYTEGTPHRFAMTLLPRRVPASGTVQFISQAPFMMVGLPGYAYTPEGTDCWIFQLPLLIVSADKETYSGELAIRAGVSAYGGGTLDYSPSIHFGYDDESGNQYFYSENQNPILNAGNINKVYFTRIDIIYQTNA